MKTLIKNGRIIDPKNKRDELSNLFIAEDRICGVGNGPEGFEADKIIDAENKIICPGFIEIGCSIEDLSHSQTNFEKELEAATSGGFTTVCLLPSSKFSIEKLPIDKKSKSAKIKFLGALTIDLAGEILAEMEGLKRAGCIGLSTGGKSIINTSVLRNALAYASSLGMLVLLDSHDPWLNENGGMRSGAASILAGLPAIPKSSELVGLSRNLILVQETEAKAHMRNLSVAESAELINRNQSTLISSDVSISHLLLSADSIDPFNSNFNVTPPLPTSEDRESLLSQLSKGEIDILSSQHHPVSADLKRSTFESSKPGISSFDTFLPLILRIVKTKNIELMKLIETVTVAPAKVLGIDEGNLSINSKANICVFDPNMIWQADKNSLKSLGKNTPFLNETLEGKVTQTFIEGEIVYDYQNLDEKN